MQGGARESPVEEERVPQRGKMLGSTSRSPPKVIRAPQDPMGARAGIGQSTKKWDHLDMTKIKKCLKL